MKGANPIKAVLCSLLIVAIINSYSYPQDNFSHLAPEVGTTPEEIALWDLSVNQQRLSRIIDIVLDKTSGTVCPPSCSQESTFKKEKEDFLQIWRKNPRPVNPGLEELAHYLAANAKYVAIQFLQLLVEAPEMLEGIDALEIPLDRYVERRLKEIRESVIDSPEYRSAVSDEDKNNLIYNAQVNFLANFRRLCLIKLALIMRRQERYLIDINRAGSNMSLALLQGAYIIARDIVTDELGIPQCGDEKRESRFAILLTGSISRNEHPFSDYDAIGIYEMDGRTTKGKSNKEYFDTLYREIGGIINNIGCSFDFSVSPFHNATSDLEECMSRLGKERKYISGLYPLAYGIGSDSQWGQGLVDRFNGLFNKEGDLLLAQCAFVREERPNLHSEYYQRDNIKYYKGGLAEGFDLYRIYKLINRLTECDVFKVLERIENGTDFKDFKKVFGYMCWLKVRLDLHYGSNKKFLPKGKELEIFARSLGYKGGARIFLRELIRNMGLLSRMTEKAIRTTISYRDWEALVREGGRLEEGVEVGTTVFIDREEMDPDVGRTLDLLRARMGVGGRETAYKSPRTDSDRLPPKEEAEQIKDDLVDYLKRVFGLEVSVKIDSPKRIIWPKVSWKSKRVRSALARAKELRESDEEAIERLRARIKGGLAYKRRSLEPLSVVLRTREGDIMIHDDEDIILDHKIAQKRIAGSVKSWVVEFNGSLDELGLELGEEEIIYRYQTPIGIQGISGNWRVLLEVMRLTDVSTAPVAVTDGRPIDRSL